MTSATTEDAQEDGGCAGLARAGAGGPGMLQEDDHSCVTTGDAQEDWGVQGWPEQGQGDQECSRRMITVVSLRGYTCQCDWALARQEMTGLGGGVATKEISFCTILVCMPF